MLYYYASFELVTSYPIFSVVMLCKAAFAIIQERKNDSENIEREGIYVGFDMFIFSFVNLI